MSKKILVISNNAISLHSNNGKTLSSIFSGWDNLCFAQLFFNEEIPESNKFTCFFKLSDKAILKEFLIGRGFGESGEIILLDNAKKAISHDTKKNIILKSLIYLLTKSKFLKLILRDFIYNGNLSESGKLVRWINKFNPDSIFLVGGNYNFPFNLANSLSKNLNIPLDIFITDNYIIDVSSTNFFRNVFNKKLLKTYHSVILNSRHSFAIGTDMATAFSFEFNRPFIPIMNSVDFLGRTRRVNHELRNYGEVDIVYAGGLHLGRGDAIVKFGNFLSCISNILNLNIKLTVYSLHSPEHKLLHKFSKYGVRYGGSLDHKEIESRIKLSDFVLHVESFDVEFSNLTKLSVSTKIPEYLASGACVIAFGPSDLSSIRLFANNGIGICITENDDFQKILLKLKCVFESSSERKKISQAGYSFAKEHFDVETIRNRINNLLNNNLR